MMRIYEACQDISTQSCEIGRKTTNAEDLSEVTMGNDVDEMLASIFEEEAVLA